MPSDDESDGAKRAKLDARAHISLARKLTADAFHSVLRCDSIPPAVMPYIRHVSFFDDEWPVDDDLSYAYRVDVNFLGWKEATVQATDTFLRELAEELQRHGKHKVYLVQIRVDEMSDAGLLAVACMLENACGLDLGCDRSVEFSDGAREEFKRLARAAKPQFLHWSHEKDGELDECVFPADE